MHKIQILDCTLRDGGFALEDAVKNKLNEISLFTDKDRTDIAESVSESNADIIELGAVQETDHDCSGFAIYQNIESISAQMPCNKRNNQLYAAFLRGPDIDLNKIPDYNSSLIDITRVCLRYSELKKSLDYSRELCKKGYKVFLQPMVTVRYSEAELNMVIEAANEMNAYALYFVDSYGYMTPDDVRSYYNKFDNMTNSNIKIGFHAHNNMEMAFINAVTLIECAGNNREIIIDSCANGMGQGTGNLQSEVIMNYLNEYCMGNYNIPSILNSCEIVNKYNVNQLWGYSPLRYIAARNKTAYKYAMALSNNYGLSYSEIFNVLDNIPEDLRYRYTPENADKLMKSNHLL